ncbi:MAG TPA: 3'-5' exonuclease, partial [Myxococcaceae bacterium]|nr:3'-5' exonuclease [Myxococcaceae bacterium]
ALQIYRDERAEAQGIAQSIHALVQEGFIPYNQVAVFFRTNAQSRVLEEAFRLGRVPYALVNGRSFYERAEIKDAAAYLRLMVNPKSDADLLRVINTPARGIGDTTVERLTDFSASCGRSLFECLEAVDEVPKLGAAAAKRLRGFRELLARLSSGVAQESSAAHAVERMLAETGLVASLLDEGTDESRTRAENLQEFLGAAQEFDVNREAQGTAASPAAEEESLGVEVPPLQAFLEQVSLVGDADVEIGEGRVSLMTLHSAKGLEFDAVFLAGMEDGVFPHSRALNDLAAPEELSEERRLCYVGFTRARRRLFLSLAVARSLFGELKLNPPSRFLAEVPQNLFAFERSPLPQTSFGTRAAAATPPFRRRPVEVREPRVRREGLYVDRSFDQSAGYDSGCGDGSPVGSTVRHSDFGEGRVVSCDGNGPNAKLTVNFPGVGLKRVVARFLQPAS